MRFPSYFLAFFSLFISSVASGVQEGYLSPNSLAVDNKQGIIYTALNTAKAIAVSRPAAKDAPPQRIPLAQNPNEILLAPDGKTLFASTGEANGTVVVIALDGTAPAVKATLAVGHTPQGLALSPDGKRLYVANRFSNTVSVLDLAQNKEIATIRVAREPRSLYMSPDGKTLAVGNFLPDGAANGTVVASKITLIDTAANAVRTDIVLTNGSQSVLGLTGSPDGKFLYAVHLISQYSIPATQVERGWMNTNALSIIDLKNDTAYATVLLDDVDNGAANPSATCVGGDGKLYIALQGTHEVIVLDVESMLEKIAALLAGEIKIPYVTNKAELSSSLSFTARFKKRRHLKGRSPRALAWLAADAAGGTGAVETLVVGSRYSPFLELLPAAASVSGAPVVTTTLPLGDEPAPDAVRRGELAFADAAICHQQWQSCVSCHPDGRADGLNWDQQNDGIGNPKNTKSLFRSHVTPPCMITGIRESAELAVRKGILHILQTSQPETLACDIDEYLKQLPQPESPYLAEARAKGALKKGKEIYTRARCIMCHNGENYTDMRKHNVGTGIENDKDRPFDTPALREVWRTAPYLYDGRATTILEVLTTYNVDDKHGATKKLTKEELEALQLYILTL
ncbi:MAG: beta-propeller fold lactonase family protein [Puniceicoccales bacterium]|jgi:YVTN family beta-propeller protein|nr:beta-propeller fold lactonase family protein [Puniceicoccales bacterium]